MEYESRIKSPELDALFEACLQLSTVNECYMFFDDICTITELKAIAQRLAVMKLLSEKVTYSEISGRTGASTATISRVNRCLQYGSGGYKLILRRLKKEN